MARKIYKPEEIVAKLRQVDVLTSQGESVAETIRSIGAATIAYASVAGVAVTRPSRTGTGATG